METTESNLSQTEIARAATNDPTLAETEFRLGDRTFKVVDLAYDDYVVFLAKLQPLIEAVGSNIAGRLGITMQVDPEAFTPSSLMKYCTASLPEMVCIMCRQTDPEVTIDFVKKNGKTPFRLAAIVMQQVQQNNVITEIADFFVQTVIPMMTALTPAPTTSATP